ncbi:MAG: cytotoxic translational repressor of toxin-antitoxin stability system [Deltaproteobacteria bacterium]|nr:cytotoxic translational repressor of toxin-antitoxin stability system [Deltaproteobacteria bacterium]
MTWDVRFRRKVVKQIRELPESMQMAVKFLVRDLQLNGPMARNWPYFGKLHGREDCYHCHLKKGRPTYVAVWQVLDKDTKVIEVKYVGTHEGADYRRVC